MLKVKIIKGRDGWWYHDKVEKIYEVRESFEICVRVDTPNGWGDILKDDIVIA